MVKSPLSIEICVFYLAIHLCANVNCNGEGCAH
eukprot:COSAG02_NODE_26442_length_633_cov_0.573034_1_plen_32_part_01